MTWWPTPGSCTRSSRIPPLPVSGGIGVCDRNTGHRRRGRVHERRSLWQRDGRSSPVGRHISGGRGCPHGERRISVSRTATALLHEHPGWIVLRAGYRLALGDPEELKARIKGFRAQRMGGSPNKPSCGSTFKRPPGDFPGRVIEAAGLKGTRVGQLEVSDVHANYLVNLGGGTAEDALELMRARAPKSQGKTRCRSGSRSAGYRGAVSL